MEHNLDELPGGRHKVLVSKSVAVVNVSKRVIGFGEEVEFGLKPAVEFAFKI